MREFDLNIDEALIRGLVPDDRVRKNEQFLTEAHNVVCTKLGLKEHEPIKDPFQGGFVGNYLFFNPDEIIALDANGSTEFYTVDTSLTPWQTNPITIRDFDGNIITPSGDDISITHFPGGWFVSTGQALVFKDMTPTLEFGQGEYRVYEENIARAITHHRGRIVIGGGDSTWSEKWKNIMSLMEEQIDEPVHADFGDIGDNFVLWSSIGGGDFPMFLMQPERAIFGHLTEVSDNYGYNIDDIDSTFLMDVLRQNEFGFMPMPWEGEVLGLGSMEDKVIVFGKEGISALVMASGEDINTYGFRHMMSTGILSTRGFHSSDKRTVFVDRAGMLWEVTPDLKPQKHDYQHLFNQMSLADLEIVWNEKDDEYYISDSTTCYLLSRSGLTEVDQRPTTVHFYQGTKYGLFSDSNDDETRIVSNIYDLNISGLKTINSINLGVTSDAVVEVAIDYRYKRGDAFTRTNFVGVNDEGNAYLRVTCLDFRVVVKCSDFTDFELDYIVVKWQASDKRNIRGVQANANANAT